MNDQYAARVVGELQHITTALRTISSTLIKIAEAQGIKADPPPTRSGLAPKAR